MAQVLLRTRRSPCLSSSFVSLTGNSLSVTVDLRGSKPHLIRFRNHRIPSHLRHFRATSFCLSSYKNTHHHGHEKIKPTQEETTNLYLQTLDKVEGRSVPFSIPGERYRYEVIKHGTSSVQYDRRRYGGSGLKDSLQNQPVNTRYSNKPPNHGKVSDFFQLRNRQSKSNNSPLSGGNRGNVENQNPFPQPPYIPLDTRDRRNHHGTYGKRGNVEHQNYTYVKYVPSGGNFPEDKRGEDNSYSGIGEELGVSEVDEKVFQSKWIVRGQNKKANMIGTK